MKKICFLKLLVALFLILQLSTHISAEITLFDGKHPVTYNLPRWKDHPVIEMAAGMFDSDIENVTGIPAKQASRENSVIRFYNLSTATDKDLDELAEASVNLGKLNGRKDSFCLKVHEGKLYAVGTDDRGTAYAILEISRLAGVSPWVWWNDATPIRKQTLSLPDDFVSYQSPSVEYRGIFLNDEDWSMRPWSCMTFDKGQRFGTIGVKTYKEIFKLLLRLRANTIWPAMHEGTTPFYFITGAKETADSCGIIIGTSHCEPLLRNNVGEWDQNKLGAYNYITNRDAIRNYWAERLQEAGKYENIYTIGMRGIHDGNMEGVRSMDEKISALRQVIADQRELLKQYVDSSVTSIPQIFVPYKEVLTIMDHGLTVPDDITLMWCDDNYGYLTRLSDPDQRNRKGGAGIYYHLSYWGRPHDYLWLGTTQPGLIGHEMKTAYDNNARKIWIANVHDLKTASYLLELFLDMAWDINNVDISDISIHLSSWLCREFGDDAGKKLLPVMSEYYRLCAIRRPEHMGWSQVELSDRKAYPRGRSHVVDTEFSFSEFSDEADRYLDSYEKLIAEVTEIERSIPPERRNSYFAQIKYPVMAAGLMTRKMLEAQRARSYAIGKGDASRWINDSLMLGACARSLDAYFKIRRLTAFYNDSLAGGKWKYSMSMNPRDLYVFNPPVLPTGLTEAEIAKYLTITPHRKESAETSEYIARNADSFDAATYHPQPTAMLGHSHNAVLIPQGESLTFDIDWNHDGEASLITALIPTHPNNTGDIRIAVSIDGDGPQVVSFKERGRTDSWKENVMRNQARVTTEHKLSPGHHIITVKAIDDHVILDQLMLDSMKNRKFYLIPTDQLSTYGSN